MMDLTEISGNIVDVINSEIYPGTLRIFNGRIIEITRDDNNYKRYIIPGFIDSHIHIESSALTPSEFARVSVIHGTVAVVTDPHEIANILGVKGIHYMIKDSQKVPLKYYFGAPSCVPASAFETSGSKIDEKQTEELLRRGDIYFLSEVMDYNRVINNDPVIRRKISIAKKYSKNIDGHAPGIRGEALTKYISAGISTDHECYTKEEAIEKISLGMKIQIREGSVAKNFEELFPLLESYYTKCMFCSDDKHPDDLIKGHINKLVKRAVDSGIDIMKILAAACVNPVLHYNLDVGLLRKGDYADFLVLNNIDDLRIEKTFINGEMVADKSGSLIEKSSKQVVNNFNVTQKKISDFTVRALSEKGMINVIEALDGQVITNKLSLTPQIIDGQIISDIKRDILKVVVVNRYKNSKVSIGFVRNFGLKEGAIASSVAHDSHNIIAVGTSDEDICRAVNLIIEKKGGICTVSGEKEKLFHLPIAGIISDEEYDKVANRYTEIDSFTKSLGLTLSSPLMTLSFMTLLVIPKLKISDKGLFDAEKYEFIEVFRENTE